MAGCLCMGCVQSALLLGGLSSEMQQQLAGCDHYKHDGHMFSGYRFSCVSCSCRLVS